MNDFFTTIQEIIKTEFYCQQTGEKLILQDIDQKTRKKLGNPVEVKKNGKIVCLQLDKKNIDIFPFFNSVKHLCKISDRILFYSNEKCLYVFIIELKTANTTDSVKQVKATYVLAEYIVHTVRRMLNFKQFEVRYRGIVFSDKGVKGGTKPVNLAYTKVENTSLEFQHLRSGSVIHF
jgi:hypothetical protein